MISLSGGGLGVAQDSAGEAAWLWIDVTSGGILFVGTELAADLIRYRQGDPAQAEGRTTRITWGFDFERPNYLYECQLEGESPSERHADWWMAALVELLRERAHCTLKEILPGGAPGAVVLTGDDDQAYLEKYVEQLALLGQTPITYFLHPQTRHTRATIRAMLNRKSVDLGLHPDAIDAPEHYGSLLHAQVAWFERIIKKRPVSVRNHGYLNSGYWGHLPSWLAEDIRFSANLPGVDGRVLNGSLLPSRAVMGEQMTGHWSILTAIGDGIRYATGRSDEDGAKCIEDLAGRIQASGVPGIIVLNLHPQNVADTLTMHHAVLHVVKNGFHPWTVADCLKWFAKRDGTVALDTHHYGSAPRSTLQRIRALFQAGSSRSRDPR